MSLASTQGLGSDPLGRCLLESKETSRIPEFQSYLVLVSSCDM